MTKVQQLVEELREIASHLNAASASKLEETITYLHLMEQGEVEVFDTCAAPCQWEFFKSGPAYLNGDFARELNTARKYHPCRIKLQEAAEAAATAAAKTHNVPPLATNPRFRRPPLTTGCWNCFARLSSDSCDRCAKCRRLICGKCRECLCGYHEKYG